MRLIDADKLMWKYKNLTGDCLVPVSTVRLSITETPTINPYEWISINDRLPEQHQEVITYRGGHIGRMINVYTYMGNDTWEDHYGYWNSAEGEGITHWTPLPKLPDTKEN